MSIPDDAEPQDGRPVAARSWLLPILFLAGVTVFAVYYLGLLHGRPVLWTDSYEYALAGRALAEGRGLTTDSATVMEFAMLYRGTLPVPYFFHDVGNSLLHALTYRLFGSSDAVIPMASGLCFALLAPATFVLGRRLFGARVGALATVLVLTNAQLLAHSTTGLSETPTALGLTVLLGLLAPSATFGALKRVTIGAAFGALVVLRSNAFVFLPWICLFLWTLPVAEGSGGPRPPALARSRVLALFLAGFCLVWGPAAIRTQIGLGRPLATVASYYIPLFHTSAIAGSVKDVYSSPGLDVDPRAFFAEHPGELASKALWQLGRLIPELLRGGGLWVKNDWVEAVLLFLFVLGVVAPPPRETVAQTRARWLLLAMLGTSLVVGLAVFLRWRHLYAFLPVVLVYDAEVIMRVFGKGDEGRHALGPGAIARLAFVVVVLAALGWGRLAGDVGGEFAEGMRANNDYYQALGEFLRQKTRRGAVVLVRCPEPLSELRALGWYGRRQLVEHSPYTEVAVLAHKGPSRVFFLVTSGPGQAHPVDDGIPGFVSVARWNSGSGDHAALFAAPR